jgi:nitrilase
MTDLIKVGLAQIAPVWLDRAATLEKVAQFVSDAGSAGCDLVTFGEGLVPGYPFWIERTDGARFNSPRQKRMFSHYLDQGVVIERGDLEQVAGVCGEKSIAAFVGVMERPPDRGGHSLYCSLVYIDQQGVIRSVHRKLQPTYEERLAWSPGDGHGLRVHALGPFLVGGLNCWENWMPLVRSALYAQGEDLHVAAWPGGSHNTTDITRFIALESRSFVVSTAGLMRPADMAAGIPLRDELLENAPPFLANGGSAVAAPNGEWVIEPVEREEGLLFAELDHALVREERQNFDPVGHYARPDVTKLTVNRARQVPAEFA